MTEKAPFTTLILARWVAPMAPVATPIEHGAVLIDDGRIAAVGTARALLAQYPAATRVERPGHLLCPGFVNAHALSPLSLLRGRAEQLPRSRWLQEGLWPVERRWLDPNFVRDGTALALCEMTRAGITCVNDAYDFPDVMARAYDRFGLRGRIGLVVADAASPWAGDAAEFFSKGLAVRDEYAGHDRLAFAFAPRAAATLSEATLVRVRKLSDQLDEPVHAPLHATRAEVQQSLADHDERPLARLQRLGLVSGSLQAVHAVDLNAEELTALAAAGAHVVHCPQTDLKLRSAPCPVPALREHGINIALGSGAAASNNRLDLLAEMRMVALQASGVSAADALHMATLGGARALGLGDDIGSIEVGKWADLVCVDLSGCATQPVYDPITTLVHAAGREHVSDVWVAGRALVRAGELIAADERQIVDNAHAWARKIGTA